jgi:hypothetical protein
VWPHLLLRLWMGPAEASTAEASTAEASTAEASGSTTAQEPAGPTLFFGVLGGGGMGPTTQGFGHYGFTAGAYGRRLGAHFDVAILHSPTAKIDAYELTMLGFRVGLSVCHVPRTRGGFLLLPLCAGFEGGLLSTTIGPHASQDFDAVSEGIKWGAGRLSIGAMLDFNGYLLGTTWTLSAPTNQKDFPSVVPHLKSMVPLGFHVSVVLAIGSRD